MTIVVALLAGLVLLSGVLQKVPGIGQSLERLARGLAPFEIALGVIAMILGMLEILSFEGILLILAGLALAVGALRTIPSIGPSLGRLGTALREFRYVLGTLLLLVGLVDLLILVLGLLGAGRLR